MEIKDNTVIAYRCSIVLAAGMQCQTRGRVDDPGGIGRTDVSELQSGLQRITYRASLPVPVGERILQRLSPASVVRVGVLSGLMLIGCPMTKP